MVEVSVVYALPEHITLIACQVAADSSVQAAIEQSGILAQCQLDLSQLSVGIYGKRVELSETVQAGDRIEIYRPLLADPKEIRRRRAHEQR